MDMVVQAVVWLGAGITLFILVSRRRKRRAIR